MDSPHGMRFKMEQLVQQTQDQICRAVEDLDGTRFFEDGLKYSQPSKTGRVGSGTTRILQDGNVFEKAGVATSIIRGTMSAESVGIATGHLDQELPEQSYPFFAAGVSLILHPHNPLAPTAHANYRYFELGRAEAPTAWWFGGGADLTPAYLFDADAVHFHRCHQAACDRFDPAYYPRFKHLCDEYFFLPHRGERRGIGGIWFDNLNDRAPEAVYAFVAACAAAFVPAYLPLVARRAPLPFTTEQKRWQQLRRGRYVEFNLIYDRGTIFGLKSGGHVESILMSLPLVTRWEYDVQPLPDSPEARLVDVLRTPRDWLAQPGDELIATHVSEAPVAVLS